MCEFKKWIWNINVPKCCSLCFLARKHQHAFQVFFICWWKTLGVIPLRKKELPFSVTLVANYSDDTGKVSSEVSLRMNNGIKQMLWGPLRKITCFADMKYLSIIVTRDTWSTSAFSCIYTVYWKSMIFLVSIKKKKKRQTQVTHLLRINRVCHNQTARLQLEY